jgi:hypothetical protein
MYYVIHRIPFTRFLNPLNSPSKSLRRKTNIILSTVFADILASTVRRTTKTVPTSSIDARVNRLLVFEKRSKSDPVKEEYRREIVTYMANLGKSDKLQFLLDLNRDHTAHASTGSGIFDPLIAHLASATATGNLTAMHFFFVGGGSTAWSSHLLSSLPNTTVNCIFRAAFRAAMANGKEKTIQFLMARFARYMVSSLHNIDQARHVAISAIHDAAVSQLPRTVQHLFGWTRSRLSMDIYDRWHAFPGELESSIRTAAQSGCADTTEVMLHEILTLKKTPVNPVKQTPYKTPVDYAQEAFYTACKHGHVKVTRRLLDQQDVEISHVSHQALYIATRYQRRAIIDVLLQYGADINDDMLIYTAVDRGYVLTTLHFIHRGAKISREIFERCREKESEMAVDSGRLVAYYLLAMQCDSSWIDPVTRSYLEDIGNSESLRGRVMAALQTKLN